MRSNRLEVGGSTAPMIPVPPEQQVQSEIVTNIPPKLKPLRSGFYLGGRCCWCVGTIVPDAPPVGSSHADLP